MLARSRISTSRNVEMQGEEYRSQWVKTQYRWGTLITPPLNHGARGVLSGWCVARVCSGGLPKLRIPRIRNLGSPPSSGSLREWLYFVTTKTARFVGPTGSTALFFARVFVLLVESLAPLSARDPLSVADGSREFAIPHYTTSSVWPPIQVGAVSRRV